MEKLNFVLLLLYLLFTVFCMLGRLLSILHTTINLILTHPHRYLLPCSKEENWDLKSSSSQRSKLRSQSTTIYLGLPFELLTSALYLFCKGLNNFVLTYDFQIPKITLGIYFCDTCHAQWSLVSPYQPRCSSNQRH